MTDRLKIQRVLKQNLPMQKQEQKDASLDQNISVLTQHFFEDDQAKLKQALSQQVTTNFIAQDDEDDSSSGQSGDGGAIVEKRFFAETFGLIRVGEKEFGIAHDFDLLAYLAKIESQADRLKGELGQQQTHGQLLKKHPILGDLSKFDGDTPEMSLDPTQNTDAQDRYENRLQLGLAAQNRPQITPKPV